MQLQESGQMYLETIYVLLRDRPAVHSIDISEHMGYSKPSVSRAVGLLKNGNYITIRDDGHIALTPEGRQIAQKILTRHTLLTQMLVHIGVSQETAAADACKMEHVISDETFEAIKNHIQSRESKT